MLTLRILLYHLFDSGCLLTNGSQCWCFVYFRVCLGWSHFSSGVITHGRICIGSNYAWLGSGLPFRKKCIYAQQVFHWSVLDQIQRGPMQSSATNTSRIASCHSKCAGSTHQTHHTDRSNQGAETWLCWFREANVIKLLLFWRVDLTVVYPDRSISISPHHHQVDLLMSSRHQSVGWHRKQRLQVLWHAA